MRSHRFAASLLVSLAAALPAHAQNEAFPAKPVRLIVPSSPGGGLDVLSRLMAAKLSGYWGQQMIVDNRPGAAMVFVNDGGLVINPLITRDTPYTYKDFAPVGLWVAVPLVITVTDAVPAKTFQEFLGYLRANPGKVNFALADDNSRLASELFKSVANVDYVHVPYKGAAPTMNALMAGEAHFAITDPVASVNAAKSGKVRMLAVTSAQRSKGLPQLPTAAEAGLPGYVTGTWGGMLAPAGTPAAIVAKLNADARRALAEPDVIEKFQAVGLEVRPGSPEEFAQLIRADADKWAALIKDRNLKFGE
jgi:tripartite-type tricarboxylate transporter receptor subunit TctC